jgi:hypothetical protein
LGHEPQSTGKGSKVKSRLKVNRRIGRRAHQTVLTDGRKRLDMHSTLRPQDNAADAPFQGSKVGKLTNWNQTSRQHTNATGRKKRSRGKNLQRQNEQKLSRRRCTCGDFISHRTAYGRATSRTWFCPPLTDPTDDWQPSSGHAR